MVSLKKADKFSYDDISEKWKEHAIFVAFSPSESAKIAVIVVSENDEKGGGGSQAAPIAKKIIEKYWQLYKKRNEQDKIVEDMKKIGTPKKVNKVENIENIERVESIENKPTEQNIKEE